jgi:tight adherence protein B
VLELLAAILAFIAAAALTYALATRSGTTSLAERRLRQLAEQGKATARDDDLEAKELFRNSVSSVGPLRELLSSLGWAAANTRALERAGLSLKVSEYLAIRVLLAMFAALLMLLIIGPTVAGLIIGIVVGILGFLAPAFYVRSRIERRQREIADQLAETLQLIANALRSGFAFLQAVKLAHSQVPPPMGDELAQFLQDTALGAPTDDALRAMAERSGSHDLDLVVTTIIIQRTTGGRLSEVLETIAETMRERELLQSEMRAMTSQQRLTGNILTIYPLVLVGIFSIISPSLMKVLITEPAGNVILVIAIILQGAGALAMRRVLDLEV